jgi:hypothetical protein
MGDMKMREKQEDLVVGKYTIKPSDPNYAGYKALMNKTSPAELERHLKYKENIGKIENRITREAYLIELDKAFNMRKKGDNAGADEILSNLDRFLKNRGVLESKPVPSERKARQEPSGAGNVAEGTSRRARAEPTGAAGNVAEAPARRARQAAPVEEPAKAEEKWDVPAAGGATAVGSRRIAPKPRSEEQMLPGRPVEESRAAEYVSAGRVVEVGTMDEARELAKRAPYTLLLVTGQNQDGTFWCVPCENYETTGTYSSGAAANRGTQYLKARVNTDSNFELELTKDEKKYRDTSVPTTVILDSNGNVVGKRRVMSSQELSDFAQNPAEYIRSIQ